MKIFSYIALVLILVVALIFTACGTPSSAPSPSVTLSPAGTIPLTSVTAGGAPLPGDTLPSPAMSPGSYPGGGSPGGLP